MPAGDNGGYQLFTMRKAKNLGVLDHIGTVAGMAVKVDRNTDIMQQCRCFQ